MLYLYEGASLVNCGPRSILLHLYYHLLQALFTFCKHYFTLPQTNISFHTIRILLYFQQTSEIDNLTVCWGKVVWLCCMHVPCCCWRWSHAPDYFLAPLPKSASNNLRKWFLSPTGRLNLGFILRKNLLLCSSYLPLGVSQLVLWDIIGFIDITCVGALNVTFSLEGYVTELLFTVTKLLVDRSLGNTGLCRFFFVICIEPQQKIGPS
jgi:hypothetical protein